MPAWWQRLGLPGLIDIHVHFMPKPVMDAVWRYFDEGERHYGTAWPVHYRGSETERVDTLRALGVRAFPALVYPHKPGMAESLSEWAMAFAGAVPECVPTGDVLRRAERRVLCAARGGSRGSMFECACRSAVSTRGIRCCTRSGGCSPKRGCRWWCTAAAARSRRGTPVPGRSAGARGQSVAHGGDRTLRRPGVRRAPRFVERLANVHVDTTMVGTEFMNSLAPLPAERSPRLGDLGDRVVLGTDFPNIPYPSATQHTALRRSAIGDDWLRAVCWDNGPRLLGVA